MADPQPTAREAPANTSAHANRTLPIALLLRRVARLITLDRPSHDYAIRLRAFAGGPDGAFPRGRGAGQVAHRFESLRERLLG